ncbi:MAG: tetratricopeptide repeat protein [Planctomycetes bacterium]|nr:tetratricopeptide repeat protein [Planctomycetota bacterium]
MTLALLVVALLAAAPQEPPPAPDAPALHAILGHRPDEWPRAAPGTWAGWSPDAPPPEAARAALVAAAQAYARRDLPESLARLYDALRVVPDYPPALHQAGVIYFRLRRYGDAITAFERFLAVVPERVGDTRALGHCYYTLGDYEKARAHYDRVLAAEPDSVEALRGRGLAEMRLGLEDDALATLGRVMELDPAHADAQTWIAQILYDAERTDEALAAAERARDLDPFDPRPWYLLAQCRWDLGEDEAGDAAHARFSELNQIAQEIRAAEARLLYDPDQPAVYATLIALNRRAGDLARVEHWMVRWVQSNPRDVGLRIAALDLAEELGNVEGARACAQGLAALAGEHLDAWRRLARYYASTRERLKQLEAEEQVSRLSARAGGER